MPSPGVDLLLLGAFAALGVLATRNIGLFGVAAPLVLARNTSEWLDHRSASVRCARLTTGLLSVALVALALAVGSGWWALRTGSMREPGLGVMTLLFPVGAAEWIARETPPGRIYHHMADGGYLIWRLYPDHRVLADGRQQVYGARMSRLADTSLEGFQALDAEHHFGVALLSYNHVDYDALLRWLHEHHAWQLAYVDDSALIFVRQLAEGAARVDLDLRDPALFPPLDGERSLSDFLARHARLRFYNAFGRSYEVRRYASEIERMYPAFVHW